jgi:hypothetical protein
VRDTRGAHLVVISLCSTRFFDRAAVASCARTRASCASRFVCVRARRSADDARLEWDAAGRSQSPGASIVRSCQAKSSGAEGESLTGSGAW